MDDRLLELCVGYHGKGFLEKLRNERPDFKLPNFISAPENEAPNEFSRQPMLQSKILGMVARKSDLMFKHIGQTPEFPHSKGHDDYSHTPPIEAFMDPPDNAMHQHFIKSLKPGDVVSGRVSVIQHSGLVVKLICVDIGQTRMIHQLNIHAFCPTREIPRYVARDEATDSFMVNDHVRGVVLTVIRETSKIIVSLQQDALSPEIGFIRLGLIQEDDYPQHYKQLVKAQEDDSSYSDMLHQTQGFKNSSNVQSLAVILGLDTSVPSSFMRNLDFSKVPKSEFAESLRKSQSYRWAISSVAKGVEHFKQGKHVEAMQYLNKALQIDEENVEALVARGALYANNESYEKAMDDFNSALGIDPQHSNAKKYYGETLLAHGRSLMDQGKLDEAETVIKKARKYGSSEDLIEEWLQEIETDRQALILKKEEMKKIEIEDATQSVMQATTEKLRKLVEEDRKRHKQKREKDLEDKRAIKLTEEKMRLNEEARKKHDMFLYNWNDDKHAEQDNSTKYKRQGYEKHDSTEPRPDMSPLTKKSKYDRNLDISEDTYKVQKAQSEEQDNGKFSGDIQTSSEPSMKKSILKDKVTLAQEEFLAKLNVPRGNYLKRQVENDYCVDNKSKVHGSSSDHYKSKSRREASPQSRHLTKGTRSHSTEKPDELRQHTKNRDDTQSIGESEHSSNYSDYFDHSKLLGSSEYKRSGSHSVERSKEVKHYGRDDVSANELCYKSQSRERNAGHIKLSKTVEHRNNSQSSVISIPSSFTDTQQPEAHISVMEDMRDRRSSMLPFDSIDDEIDEDEWLYGSEAKDVQKSVKQSQPKSSSLSKVKKSPDISSMTNEEKYAEIEKLITPNAADGTVTILSAEKLKKLTELVGEGPLKGLIPQLANNDEPNNDSLKPDSREHAETVVQSTTRINVDQKNESLRDHNEFKLSEKDQSELEKHDSEFNDGVSKNPDEKINISLIYDMYKSVGISKDIFTSIVEEVIEQSHASEQDLLNALNCAFQVDLPAITALPASEAKPAAIEMKVSASPFTPRQVKSNRKQNSDAVSQKSTLSAATDIDYHHMNFTQNVTESLGDVGHHKLGHSHRQSIHASTIPPTKKSETDKVVIKKEFEKDKSIGTPKIVISDSSDDSSNSSRSRSRRKFTKRKHVSQASLTSSDEHYKRRRSSSSKKQYKSDYHERSKRNSSKYRSRSRSHSRGYDRHSHKYSSRGRSRSRSYNRRSSRNRSGSSEYRRRDYRSHSTYSSKSKGSKRDFRVKHRKRSTSSSCSDSSKNRMHTSKYSRDNFTASKLGSRAQRSTVSHSSSSAKKKFQRNSSRSSSSSSSSSFSSSSSSSITDFGKKSKASNYSHTRKLKETTKSTEKCKTADTKDKNHDSLKEMEKFLAQLKEKKKVSK